MSAVSVNFGRHKIEELSVLSFLHQGFFCFSLAFCFAIFPRAEVVDLLFQFL